MKPIQWLTEDITDVVRPVIRDFLIDVYEKPETYLDPEQKDASNQLIKFQMALKKVPNWTTTQIKKQIDERNFPNIINYENSHKLGKLAAPTPDHYVPVLYSLGLTDAKDEIKYFYESATSLPAFSERSFIVG